MHERYGSKGLVCLSVSVDDAKQHDKALQFLTKQKAAFANYRLDESNDFWGYRLGIGAPPAVFVFDSQGRRAGKFEGEDNKPEDVEKLVQQLLGS